MRTARFALLAGVATLGLAGLTRLADAQPPSDHVLTIQLPDGQVEQIRYAGDVPPRIMMLPAPAEDVAQEVAGPSRDDPFAALEQMSAAMDAQMASLMHQAQAMANRPIPDVDGMLRAGFGGLPTGGQGFSFVGNWTGSGVCTHSVTITSRGDGARPQVVSQTSGDCGTAKGGADPVQQDVSPLPRAGTIKVKGPAAPPVEWVRPAIWQHG
jgi:hypothetical protein